VRWLSGQIIDALYEYDDSGAIVDNLANGAPKTTDGKTWTITLKTGVLFHNGDPFTAEHVVATMQALAKAPTNAFGGQVGTISSIKATNASTVTFTLTEANYIIPDVLAVLPMLHKDHTQDMTKIIGTGPFKWSELVSGSHLTLVANPKYHLGAPFLDQVTFRFVPDPNTRVVDLLQKTSNVSMLPAFSTLSKLSSSKNVTVIDVPAAVMLPIHVNVNSAVFKDVRVRQALGFAMDRTRVRDIVFDGKAQLFQGGAVPPGLRGYDSSNPYFPAKANLAKAKALLAEAGVTTPVKFTAAVYNTAESVAAMQVIQQDWKAAGFDMEIQSLDLASFAKILVSKKFDMCVSYEFNGTWWAKDGINQLANYMTGTFANWTNYSDPAFDALLTKSRATSDAATQTALWKQMDHMLAVAAVNLIPAVPHLTGGEQSQVQGINMDALKLSYLDLRKAAIG
jgi:peptide/nickel transport system substrate-binding protein